MSARAPRSSSPTRSRPWRWRAATWCSRAPTSARRAHCSPGRWDSWPRSDPRMKKVLVLLIVLALAGAGYWYFALRTGSGSVPGVQYRTGKVERGELIEGVAASGTVQPVVLVQVGTQISGAIEKLFADFNSQVKAGQTIAPLDSRRLAAQVTSDEAAVARAVEVGQTVAASLQAPTLFLIAQDLTKVQVQVSVPEADIGKIHKGQPARFSVDAYSDKSFEGTVSQVRLASTTVQNVVTYTVVVDASNPDGLLFPGMTASLTFEIARSSKDALHVPATALRLQPAAELVEGAGGKGRKYVYVVAANKRLRAIPVKVGISDLLSTAIEPVDAQSLPEGAEVVTAILRDAEAATTNPFAPPRIGGGRNPR